MSWILVVSEDEGFQRHAMRRLRDSRPVVGATGEAAARALVGAVNVSSIIVDSADEIGRRFLALLAGAPVRSIPSVIAVGPGNLIRRFRNAPDLDAALISLAANVA
jgi:hypothetical protein